MNTCKNCGALPGEPCRHDAGCTDTDRATLEPATPPLGTDPFQSVGVADSSVELRVKCAWCDVVMCEGAPGASTSHSICELCFKTVEAEPPAASLAVRVARAAWEKYASPQLRLDGAA